MNNSGNINGLSGTQYYFKLEQLATRIFTHSGYEISSTQSRLGPDIIFQANGNVYYVEVKGSSSFCYCNHSMLEKAAVSLVNYVKKDNEIPILLIFAVIAERQKQDLINNYHITILDLANLLYIVNGTDLQDELVSLLPFAVDQINPIAPTDLEKIKLNLNWLQHRDEIPDLLLQLDNCIVGKPGAHSFELICTDLLRYIFADDLSLWKKQASSNKQLYRFDLLCRIKDGLSKSFWCILESYFHTKYIVFEFKNLNEIVTQKEIYTTEKYLYNKALRNVAIIVARSGFHENSVWATKGCLREEGKLILLLTVEEMKEMVQLKRDNEDPSGFLLSKLDDLLIELEK